MAHKEKKIVHRTANGREFNMDQFRQKNELAPAVGNLKVNARGDELGRGGKIIKKRTEILDEYYRSQTKQDETPLRQELDDYEEPVTKSAQTAATSTPKPTAAPPPPKEPPPAKQTTTSEKTS